MRGRVLLLDLYAVTYWDFLTRLRDFTPRDFDALAFFDLACACFFAVA